MFITRSGFKLRRFRRRRARAAEITRLILCDRNLSAEIALMNDEEAKKLFEMVATMFRKEVIESTKDGK